MTTSVQDRLVVFDVDGTLVDSRELLMKTASEGFAATGLPPPCYDDLRQIVGLSLRDGLAQLVPKLRPDQIDALIEHYRTTFNSLRSDPEFKEPLYPGAAELLTGLKAGGWRIAMATGKSRRGVEAVMAAHGWADLFESTHCASDGPGKPDPAMLIEAMRVLGVPASRTIMVGDTAHDIRMAKAAGVRVVAVTWGFHTRDELAASAPDLIAGTFVELKAELERFATG